MKLMHLITAATAVVTIAAGAACAQPYGQARDQGGYSQNNGYGNQRDPRNYYSQTDQNGYYDRNGRYQRMRGSNDRRTFCQRD